MATEFETILLQENLNPTVKLEPMTWCDDEHNDTNSGLYYSTTAAEAKIGEIFSITKDHFKFVCTHCFAEFPLLLQFTAHAQRHLQEIYSESFEVVDVKPLQLDCDDDPSAEAAVQYDDDLLPNKKRKIRKRPQYKCADCDKYFDLPCHLRTHRVRVHERRMYRCAVCNLKTSWKYNIQRHVKTRHPNDESFYSLEICYGNESTQSKQSNVVECFECDQTFAAESFLREHWNAEHCCKFCNEKVRNLRQHMTTHHPTNNVDSTPSSAVKSIKPQKNALGLYECSDCDQSFERFWKLARHRNQIHEGRKFCCTICGAKVCYKYSIERHVSATHPDHPPDSFVEIFESLSNKEANNSEEYQSNDDGDLNEQQMLRRAHVEPPSVKLTAVKPLYECSDCDQTFKFACKLIQHRDRIHDGKQFCCSICGVKVDYKYSIERHMSATHPDHPPDSFVEILKKNQTNNDENNSKEFQSNDDKQSNEVDDRNVEPKVDPHAKWIKPQKNELGLYDCSDCDQSFDLFWKLARHRNIVHRGRKYRCTICGVKLVYKYSIERHVSSAHPKRPTDSFVEIFENENNKERQSNINRDLYEANVNYVKRKREIHSSVAEDTATAKLPTRKYFKRGHYACSDCDESFNYYCKLVRHRNRFHDGKKFCCQICGTKVNYKYSIERHMSATHPDHSPDSFVEIFDGDHNDGPVRSNKKFKCHKCNKIFSSVSVLKQHRKQHLIKQTFKCDICTVSFAYRKLLTAHMNKRHPTVKLTPTPDESDPLNESDADKRYQCPICKQRYCFKRSFEKHLLEAHPKVQFEFRNINGLSATTATSSSAIDVSDSANIDEWQKEDADQQSLVIIEDKIIGHRYEKSICTICNIEFKNKWSLVWHCRHVHENPNYMRNPTSFECYLCHMNFETAATLKAHFRIRHYRIYYKTRPCATCGQQFDDAFLFTKHRRWHKEQLIGRPHKCDVCGKTFVERFQLSLHSIQHATSRDFVCEICGKAYKTARSKRQHIRTHTGVGRAQCDECGKILRDGEKLKRHMLTHTGERPYECEYCHKRFRQSYNLTTHKRSHTGEYIHYCTPCKKGFGYKRELRKHNLRVHGIEKIEETDLN